MGSGQMLYRLHVRRYERSHATFDSTLMCCCALVGHMTHSSPFHRNSRAARRPNRWHARQPIAYKQLKHYVRGRYSHTSCHVICHSVVCFWTHPLVYRICKCFRNWPRPMIEFGLNDLLTLWTLFPRDRMRGWQTACLWLHAPVSLAVSQSVWSTPGNEVGLIMRLYAPKKEMRYKYLDKIDRLQVEIVHILVIITAVTKNHGNCLKSRHKAKITVITAIVNSWFTYIPNDNATVLFNSCV